MSYSNLIAMEVPTYNHPDVVEDVLSNCAEHYKRCGIEIYYYDSSDNDDTKKVIERFNAEGYDNLIHVQVETGAPPHIKRDMIYTGVALKKHYRYVWMSKDRAWVEESALKEILDAADENYDAIIIATRPGDKTYIDSAEELYQRWAPISTSMNVAILNTESVLKDYTAPIPNRPMCDFGHFYALFDGLSRIDNPRIARIEMGKRICMSNLSESTWTNDAFIVWKDSWIDINDALPDIYNPYKDYVIKKVASLPWILAERNRLLQLHELGVLTPETLSHALSRWERISDIPKGVVMDIANDNYDIRYDLTQIQDRNELTKLLVEMAGYIREGKMSKEQIPIDDVANAVKIELLKDEDKPRRNIRVGAVDSILEDFSEREYDSEQVAKIFQQLLGYVI